MWRSKNTKRGKLSWRRQWLCYSQKLPILNVRLFSYCQFYHKITQSNRRHGYYRLTTKIGFFVGIISAVVTSVTLSCHWNASTVVACKLSAMTRWIRYAHIDKLHSITAWLWDRPQTDQQFILYNRFYFSKVQNKRISQIYNFFLVSLSLCFWTLLCIVLQCIVLPEWRINFITNAVCKQISVSYSSEKTTRLYSVWFPKKIHSTTCDT